MIRQLEYRDWHSSEVGLVLQSDIWVPSGFNGRALLRHRPRFRLGVPLRARPRFPTAAGRRPLAEFDSPIASTTLMEASGPAKLAAGQPARSEEHTSELQ